MVFLAYADFSNASFGYFSDNGSSIWIDPNKKIFIILLTVSKFEKTTQLQCEVLNILTSSNEDEKI